MDEEPLRVKACPACQAYCVRPTQLGPFEVTDFIGYGGIGRVFRGECEQLPGKKFAIKVVDSRWDNGNYRLAELKHEAEVCAALGHHPAVVRAYEYGEQGSIAYLALEFVNGRNLEDELRVQGPLSEAQTAVLLLDVVAALEFLQASGYLYRDIKPQNVLVAPDGRAMICDMGLARVLVESLHGDANEHVDGSPYFIPPERLLGMGESIRSDIYALGILAFYCLKGENVFRGQSKQDVAERHVHEDASELVQQGLHNLALSQGMIDLVVSMTRRQPRDRMGTYAEIRSALKLCLLGGDRKRMKTSTMKLIKSYRR